MKGETPTSEDLLLTFKLNGGNYGIWSSAAREVLSVSEVVPIPKAPIFIAGIINRHGNVLTVLDVALLLGLPSLHIDRDSTVLFLKHKSMNIGLLIKSLKPAKKIPTDLTKVHSDSSSTGENRLIKGTTELEGISINLLDLDGVFKFLDEYSF